MLKALKANQANVSKAVEATDVGRTQHYTWLKNDEKYKESVNDITEALIDTSESNMLKRANGYEYKETQVVTDKDGKVIKQTVTKKTMPPNVDANAKFLAAKGRERGWGDKLEVGGMKDAPAIEVGVVEIVTRKEKPKTD